MHTAYSEQKAEAIKIYIQAISDEIQSGYEYENTVARINAAGFLEGIVHLGIILGLESEAVDTAKIERTVRNAIESKPCRHEYYSTTPYPSEEIPEASENRCDNCNTVLSLTL